MAPCHTFKCPLKRIDRKFYLHKRLLWLFGDIWKHVYLARNPRNLFSASSSWRFKFKPWINAPLPFNAFLISCTLTPLSPLNPHIILPVSLLESTIFWHRGLLTVPKALKAAWLSARVETCLKRAPSTAASSKACPAPALCYGVRSITDDAQVAVCISRRVFMFQLIVAH